ncbi:MAG: hypothetical protein IIC71_10520 [Acidobacteria bacterium]|nr:hypothetical protein [Acidobacteriota bacterium]
MASETNYSNLQLKDRDGQHQQWIFGEIDSEWCVAYRIRNVSGEPTVCEMRVLPGTVSHYYDTAKTDREPGPPIADVPRGGIKSRMIRGLKPDEARREALSVWRWTADASGAQAGEVLGRRGYSLQVIAGDAHTKRAGRPGKPDEFYAEIGAAHAALVREGSRKPNVALADQRATSRGETIKPEQIRDWLYEARRRGIVRRKPGPSWGLTAKGERLLNEAKG